MIDALDRFLADLGRYDHAPALVEHLRGVLGPEDAESYALLAYLLLPSDDLFRAFFFTPERFLIFEMLPSAEYLVVAVPLSRVSRVAETGTSEGVTVAIELDADLVRGALAGEYVTFDPPPALTPDDQPKERGQMALSAELKRAEYLLTAPAGEVDALAALREFARAARAALGL